MLPIQLSTLSEFGRQNGIALLLGATGLLTVGCLAVLLSRLPAHRQRLAEGSILCTLVWLIFYPVPFPRLDWHRQLRPDAEPTLTPEAVLAVGQMVESPERTSGPNHTEARRVRQQVSDSERPPERRWSMPRLLELDWLVWLFGIGGFFSVAQLLLGKFLLWRIVQSQSRIPEWLAAL